MNNLNNTKASEHLSFVFALMDGLGKVGDVKAITPELEQEMIRAQPRWKNYFDECFEVMKDALKLFKKYDKKGLLEDFFAGLNKKKAILNEKTFNILMGYAFEAYDNEVFNDAYILLSFVSACYPLHYKVYLYLGKVTEQLRGNGVASEFYENVTNTFKEPELLFAAANCEMSQDNLDKAKGYLLKAQEVLNAKGVLSDDDSQLKAKVDEILNLF